MTDPAALARVLCDSRAVLRDADGDPGGTGVLWKITEPDRQLDANLVRLAPGTHVALHAEPDLDVLLVVAEGSGTLETPESPNLESLNPESPNPASQDLAAGTIAWLPHGSSRALRAGDAGLAYLTVHRRRPGMQIRTPPIRPL